MNFRSSRPKEFCKKGVLKTFAKFTRKHQCQSLFFNKVEFCKIFKNTLFYRIPLVALILKFRGSVEELEGIAEEPDGIYVKCNEFM